MDLPSTFIVLDQPDSDITLSPAFSDPGLAPNRLTEYRFELLDRDENLIGLLNSVDASGSIAWSAAASIKSGGELNVRDLRVIPGHPTTTQDKALQTNLATNPNLEGGVITGWNSADPSKYPVDQSPTTPIGGGQSAMSNRIGAPSVDSTNPATNPNLEANVLTNWNQVSSSYVLTLDSIAEISGSYSALTTRSGTNTANVSEITIGHALGTNGHLPCTAGVSVTVSLDVRVELAGRRIRGFFEWYTAANALTNGTTLTNNNQSTTAMKTESRVILTAVPPAGTVGFRIHLLIDLAAGSSTTGERVWYDNFRVGGSTYFDGSTAPGYTHHWVDAANASTSEKRTSPDDVLYAVNSHPNPNLEGGLLNGWIANHPARYPLVSDAVSPISGTRSATTTRTTDTANTTASSVSWPDAVPSDIPGLSLWFNASDLSALADGTSVSTWTSRAGSSSATQSTSLARPTKQTRSGLHCVNFSTVGTPDWLTLGGSALSLSNNIAGITMFARLKVNSAPPTGVGYIFALGNGASSTQVRSMLRVNTDVPKTGGRRLDADTFTEVGTGAFGTSAIRTLCGIIDYANSDAFVFLDGAASGSSTSFLTSGNTSSTNSLNAIIGAQPGGADDHSSMDLYEILVYNRVLTTAERQQVEAYLSGSKSHFPCTAGVPVTASVDVRSDQSGRRITSFFNWYNSSNVLLSTSATQSQDPAQNVVVRHDQTAIPPAGAVSVRWQIDVTRIAGGNALTGEKVWYDNFRWGGPDYFDGSTAPVASIYTYRWTGTANASGSERLTISATADSGIAASIFLTPGISAAGFECTEAVPITFSLDVKTGTAARKIEIWMEWLDAANAVLSSETAVTAVASTTAGTVYRVSKTATPPAGAVTMRPVIRVSTLAGLAAVSEKVWFDHLLVTTAGDIPYFDGNTFGSYHWTGPPNVSTSEKFERTVVPGEPPRYEATNEPLGDMPVKIDWLTSRIKPVIILTDLETGSSREYPQGIYLPAAPVEEWNGGQRNWRVELLDKTSILDTDIYTSGGRPATYTLPSGANVIAAIVTLINSTGESTPAIQADPDTSLAAAMTWDMGTTLLKIVNDLLDAANYFSIYTDEHGQFQLIPYQAPMDRPPLYEFDSPLSYGELSRMDPNWTLDNDIYAVPNRVVLVGQGSDEVPAWVATAINNNPMSPFSYVNRGRWVTFVETEVEAVSQAALQASAERRLAEATAITKKLAVKHVYLPEIKINGRIKFSNPRAELDTWCTISNTEIIFDPLGLCTTNLTEVEAQ